MYVVLATVRTLLVCLLSLQAFADTISGKVVLDQHHTVHRVRLAGIDAPERGQAFGAKAKRGLIELAAGRTVDVQFHERDRYRRIVGKLIAADSDVNRANCVVRNPRTCRVFGGA